MTARTVVREQLQPARKAAPSGPWVRDSWTLAERRDVGDEALDLAVGEVRTLPLGLLAGAADRHPAGAQIEVGSERPDTSQARPLPRDVAGAPGSRHLDAATVDPVAADAVRGEELGAEL